MSVNQDKRAQLLVDYEKSSGVYSDFSKTVADLLGKLIGSFGVQVHTITHRAKEIGSLEGKISRPDKAYESLNQITDLAGLRITTYFAEDVDRIAEVIEREFIIDRIASVDKRKYDDPDRFGYSSLHYVVELTPSRTQLYEYSIYRGLKCEIQLRSILQHAWAEIEHDLGYKSAAGVPKEIKRRFARVASLLELADEEFAYIRVALKKYEATVSLKISEAPKTVGLDLASFRALYDFKSHVENLDHVVARAGNVRLKITDMISADSLVKRLQFFGIKNIDQLERTAQHESDAVAGFVKYWMTANIGVVRRGIGVMYLLYVLAAKSRNKNLIGKYLGENQIGTDEDRGDLVEKIFNFKNEAN